jgi:ABC-type uncharacterized transport system ATPase subunit
LPSCADARDGKAIVIITHKMHDGGGALRPRRILRNGSFVGDMLDKGHDDREDEHDGRHAVS